MLPNRASSFSHLCVLKCTTYSAPATIAHKVYTSHIRLLTLRFCQPNPQAADRIVRFVRVKFRIAGPGWGDTDDLYQCPCDGRKYQREAA